MNNYRRGHNLSAADIIASQRPGAVIHYQSLQMHQMSVTQPNGMRHATWSAAWNWFSTSVLDLPPLARAPLDMRGLNLHDVQSQLMFDARVQVDAHLPWAHGSSQPPPALMPPGSRPGLFRRLLGGGR